MPSTTAKVTQWLLVAGLLVRLIASATSSKTGYGSDAHRSSSKRTQPRSKVGASSLLPSQDALRRYIHSNGYTDQSSTSAVIPFITFDPKYTKAWYGQNMLERVISVVIFLRSRY
jgi:hypothetical protein